MQPIMTVKQRLDGHTPPIKVHVEVEKISIPMEVDTGASVSIMSENRYCALQVSGPLEGVNRQWLSSG